MIKVLHIIGALPVGGAERALEKLVTFSMRVDQSNKVQHVVVSLTGLGAIGESLNARGVQVIALHLSNISNTPLVFCKLCRVIFVFKPSVIQTWMYHADFLGGLAGKLCGVPVIWGIRNTDLRKGVSKLTFLIMRITAVLSKYIPKKIVCVAKSAETVHASYGYDKSKLIVIHNGFDVEHLRFDAYERRRIRKTLGVDSDCILIGSVARFNPYKDHNTFILAAKILSQQKKKVRFLMVGDGIDVRNKSLMQIILSAGLQDIITMVGEQDNLASYYSSMDAFCLHSISEGFPNVLAEAMSCSLPVVSTLVGDARYLVGDEGFFSEPGNPTELAKQITLLVEMSPADRRALGIRLRHRIEQNFSIHSMIKNFENVYHQVIQ